MNSARCELKVTMQEKLAELEAKKDVARAEWEAKRETILKFKDDMIKDLDQRLGGMDWKVQEAEVGANRAKKDLEKYMREHRLVDTNRIYTSNALLNKRIVSR